MEWEFRARNLGQEIGLGFWHGNIMDLRSIAIFGGKALVRFGISGWERGKRDPQASVLV
jgi:hypothetical protein